MLNHKNTKIMENYKEQLQKKIQDNCTLKSEEYKISGIHYCWSVEDNQPIHVLIDENRVMFTIMIGYDVWRVPIYLTKIFSLQEIEIALMQKFEY